VDHSHCDALDSHHNEVRGTRGGGSTTVNNRCPRCGWFSAAIEEWQRWDGRLPNETAADEGAMEVA
jgi:hypothetical protein